MDEIGQRFILYYVPGTNLAIPGGLNLYTVWSTFLVMVLLCGGLWLAVRRYAWIPRRSQALVESYVAAMDDLVSSTLELHTKEANRRFLPYLASLFLFILVSNAIVALPIPHVEEPTADLNLTVGLGLCSLILAFVSGIRARGPLGYLQEYCGPLWHTPGRGPAVWAGKLSALFFFPLHVMEEVSRLISISFRLFGNIMGGGVILVVVSTLTYFVVMPLALDAFILIFEAAIQAFIFTMLSLMYISAAIRD